MALGNQNRILAEHFRPIKNNVFVSDLDSGPHITAGGIIRPDDNWTNTGIHARWARVYAVGEKQQDVQVGQYVLVSHGRWTRGTLIEDQEGEKTIRRIDANDILMVSNDPQQDETIGQGL